MSDQHPGIDPSGSLKNIRAVTLDFWGTLYDNGPDMAPRYVSLLADALGGVPSGSLRSAFDHAESLAGEVGRMGFRLSLPAQLAVLLDQLQTSLRPRSRDRLIWSMENALLDSSPTLVEGGRQVLETLSSEGYALAIISDTGITPGRVIRQVMERDDVARFFHHWTFSDELGVNKHRKQPFLSTCLALGIAPEETLHVGDLPETDIRVARQAGLRVALATYISHRYDGESEADIVLAKLGDLPHAIAEFRGSGAAH